MASYRPQKRRVARFQRPSSGFIPKASADLRGTFSQGYGQKPGYEEIPKYLQQRSQTYNLRKRRKPYGRSSPPSTQGSL